MRFKIVLIDGPSYLGYLFLLMLNECGLIGESFFVHDLTSVHSLVVYSDGFERVALTLWLQRLLNEKTKN
jgi:hypothetical protein